MQDTDSSVQFKKHLTTYILTTKNGSKGARTPDLSRVRRTLIPAELCFHTNHYSPFPQKINLIFYHIL